MFFWVGKGMGGGSRPLRSRPARVLLPQLLLRCGGVEVACARIKITSKRVVRKGMGGEGDSSLNYLDVVVLKFRVRG